MGAAASARALSISVALLLPLRAHAQVSPPIASQPASPSADSLPAFERPNGSLLRPGTLTYSLSLTTPAGANVALGVRTVIVSDSPMGGTPGWLIAESRTGTVVPTSDSVFVARADLQPERWNATIGRALLGASFTRDSVFGAVQGYQGRSSFAMAVPGNVLPSAGLLERVIELLPLREGYHAGASLLLVDGLMPRIVPAEIVVERTESVSIGNRSTDAWRVAVRWGAMEQRLWVARDGGRVVRTEQAVPQGVLASVLQ